MLVDFGEGKCPICGDFAKEVEKKTYECGKCEISFDKFAITQAKEIKEYSEKDCN